MELLLKHDSRAVFVSNKNRPAGAKLSKLGSALLQQVPTGATSTVSTVENGKGTAAGLKLEVNSCSFEGWRLRWSVNLRLETLFLHFSLEEHYFWNIFWRVINHKNIFTERSLKKQQRKNKNHDVCISRTTQRERLQAIAVAKQDSTTAAANGLDAGGIQAGCFPGCFWMLGGDGETLGKSTHPAVEFWFLVHPTKKRTIKKQIIRFIFSCDYGNLAISFNATKQRRLSKISLNSNCYVANSSGPVGPTLLSSWPVFPGAWWWIGRGRAKATRVHHHCSTIHWLRGQHSWLHLLYISGSKIRIFDKNLQAAC